MTLEQNEPESEIEIIIKESSKKEEPNLDPKKPESLNEQDKDTEIPPIENKSPEEKKAAAEEAKVAAKKAAQEEKKAAKKAAQEEKKAAKKVAQEEKKAAEEAKVAAKKAAQENKKVTVELPAYFTNKYPDYQDEKKAEQEAILWFLGLDKDNKPLADSYSAKITYVGSKHVVSKKVKIAKRAISSNSNNWKMFLGTLRFFKKQESGALIKDPAFIKEALGTDNYKVRIILDSKVKKELLKSKHFAKDEARILGMKPRLRRDMIATGLTDVPLHKGEAAQFLRELDAKTDVRKDLYTEDQRKWLQKRIKEDETDN